jgi:hypothetical protein
MAQTIDETIESVRKFLKQYDDGDSSGVQCVADIHGLFMSPFLDAVENGKDGYLEFGSCCCSPHQPSEFRKFKVEFDMKPHGFSAKRISD